MKKIEDLKIQIETLVKNKNELLEKISEIREEENKVMNEISSIDVSIENKNKEIEELKKEAIQELETVKKEKEEILFILDSKLTNEERLEKISIYPKWERDVFYQENEKVRYQDKLYKVIQNHTSQDDWTPEFAPNLFVEIVADEVIGEFKKPTGTHDAYKKGDKVEFEGAIYISLIEANVYSPKEYPAGWKKESEV